jgi:hypothetical protein
LQAGEALPPDGIDELAGQKPPEGDERMKRAIAIVLAMGLGLGVGASSVLAGGPGCHKSKMAKAGSSCSAKTACTLGEFPTMTMKVGDETFECPMAADKAAKAHDGKIVYVVAKEEYGCKEKAMAALADAAEDYVAKFTTIACVVDGKVIYCDETSAGSGCSKSGKATLASAEGKGCSKAKSEAKAEATASDEGKTCPLAKAKAALASAASKECCKNAKFFVLGLTFDKREDAMKARDAALASVKPIKMAYIVDGEKVDCASKICPAAKKAGKVQYVVGEEKTPCEISARVSRAKAQYEAAKKAADQKLAKI